VNYAKAGDVPAPKAYKHSSWHRGLGQVKVVEPWHASKPDSGQWVCITCGEPFLNNMEATSHTPKHKLAWWCGEHATLEQGPKEI
jgi:hypothetical protein